jgi:hypothetical protein
LTASPCNNSHTKAQRRNEIETYLVCAFARLRAIGLRHLDWVAAAIQSFEIDAFSFAKAK